MVVRHRYSYRRGYQRYLSNTEARRGLRYQFGDISFGNSPFRSAVGAMTRMVMNSPTMDMGSIDQLIEWKVYQVLEVKAKRQRGEPTMHYQFTIELRVDYDDKDKNEVMKAAVQKAARHMFATASLLTDKVKPQIAIFSDDFFTGQQPMELMGDIIQQGKDELAKSGTAEGDTEISQELLNALK